MRNVTRKKNLRTFKKKDYYSGDGMLTTVWGPSMWHYLHTMSFNYPVNPTSEDKKHYREFMMSLQYVLPCKYCRQNLKNNYKVYPLTASDMASRDTFSRYVYQLHEMVNKLLKKKSGLSYCDVRERYEHFRSRCTEDRPKIFDVKGERLKKKELDKQEHKHTKKIKAVKKVAPSRFTAKNPNVLLKSCRKKKNVKRCK